MDSRLRGRPKWLNDPEVNVQERGQGATYYKCNPRSFELALLREAAAQVFCDSTMRAIIDIFPQVSYFNLGSDKPIPETIFVREVYAIGHTNSRQWPKFLQAGLYEGSDFSPKMFLPIPCHRLGGLPCSLYYVDSCGGCSRPGMFLCLTLNMTSGSAQKCYL